jgi:hypothetical protein
MTRLATVFRLRRDKGYPPDVRPFHEAASPGAAGSELVSWSAGSQSRGRPFRWHRIFACQPCAVWGLAQAHRLLEASLPFPSRSARPYSRVGTSSGPSEAFADREHTGEIDSSRRWASREADRPSWPGRVSKVAEIGSSRSWPSLAVQTPCEFSRPCARGLWPVDNTAWLTGP